MQGLFGDNGTAHGEEHGTSNGNWGMQSFIEKIANVMILGSLYRVPKVDFKIMLAII